MNSCQIYILWSFKHCFVSYLWKVPKTVETDVRFHLTSCHLVVCSQATGLCAETMRVVLERCYNDLRLLYVPNKTLKAEGFFRSNKVHLHNTYFNGSFLKLNELPRCLLKQHLDQSRTRLVFKCSS